MKRTGLIFTMLAASMSTAYAQDSGNVTVYGIVDAGVMHLTGMSGGSTTRLVSGIMDGSRFGLRGSEDLGGGYKAIFTLENRTELDTGAQSNMAFSGTQLPDRLVDPAFLNLGTMSSPVAIGTAIQVARLALGPQIGVNVDQSPPRFWDRQAYVGLITPVGAVLAGRQYTPAYEVNATFDIMQTQSALSAGQVASFPPAVDIRQSNTVQYRIQAAGVTASVMYGFGESADGAATKNRFMGGMAMYKSQGFSAGVGYNERNNEVGETSLRTLTTGASGTFGAHTVSALYGKVKDDNPTGISSLRAAFIGLGGLSVPDANIAAAGYKEALRQDGDLLHVGYRGIFGPNTIYVATSFFDDKRPADADVLSYGAGYSYAFSKRTDVNGILVRFDNRNRAQVAPGQAGYIGGVTASAGADSTSLSIGMRHRF